MTLSANHLKDICLLGYADKAKTCRYLKNDEIDASKWYCQKLQPSSRERIDVTIEAFMRKATHSTVVSVGDNCEGYPVLKHIVQGYDMG